VTVGDTNYVSCFIHKRSGDVELIRAHRDPPTSHEGSPTIAGIVPISDIMTREVICVRGDVPIETVIDLFVNQYIGCVPVVDDEGCPLGMLTKRDVVEPMANRVSTADESPCWTSLAPRTADEAMLPLAFSLDDRATVAQAAKLMATEGLHHVPIVSQKGRVIGMVSSLDIVRWLARNDGTIAS
jgi:CBS domain-containing protein